MGYQLLNKDFNDILNQLKSEYKIYGPKRFENKGRFSDTDVIGYGEIDKLEDIVLDEKTYFSPKEIIYPIRQTLFYFTEDEVKVPDAPEDKVIVFLRPCDINGIKRLDTIFLENGPYKDVYYERLREKVKFFMIECTEGFDSCFCVSMNSNKTHDYAVAIRFNEENVLIDLKDRDLLEYFENYGKAEEFTPEYIKENKAKVSIPYPEKVTNEMFEHEVWQEYTRRCIGCGRCNTSCITCSCFTMQDVYYDANKKVGERRRVWASCQIDGFTDMAGGHGFREKQGQRMRFKTMHKINDFYKRFGFHMCVGCGRCDDVCPEYISFSKCINKLYSIVEEGNNDEK